MTPARIAPCLDGSLDTPHRLFVEGFGVVAEVVVLAEFAEGARRHPQLGDRDAVVQLLEPLAVIQIGMGEREDGQVRLAAICRQELDQLIDHGPGRVVVVLGLGHVPNVQLYVHGLRHANRRAVAGANRPEDQSPIGGLNCHSRLLLGVEIQRCRPLALCYGSCQKVPATSVREQ